MMWSPTDQPFHQNMEYNCTTPRFLEYVGAPKSARLMSRSPEYWVHHMGRENTLSAALQLQHDVELILSNVQVLQQLMTSLCRTSSDVLLAVHGRQPFPSSAVQQVMPSYRVRNNSNGPVTPTSRYRDTNAHVFSRVQRLHILPGLLPKSTYVKREAKLTMQPVTENEQCCYIPCDLQSWYIVLLGDVASVLGLACQVGEVVFPQIAPCLEHICAGGGGGSVAFDGLL